MSRYDYNSNLVSEALDCLTLACDALKHTNEDIKSGLAVINNARGAKNISIQSKTILGYKSAVINYIEELETEIRKKVTEIEKFESAPWYKKFFATVGMGGLKVVEGIARVGENIFDALLSIQLFESAVIMGILDIPTGDIEKAEEFIAEDWVGSVFVSSYETGWLKSVNKYSIMAHQSTAANICKGVGNVAVYVGLSFIPYVGPVFSVIAPAGGAIGSGTEKGLQDGKGFYSSFGSGVKDGAISAAISLVTLGIGSKLTSASGAVANSVDDLGKAVSGAKSTFAGVRNALANSTDEIAGMLDDVAGALDDVANFADDAVTSGTATTKSATDAFNSAKNLSKTIDGIKDAAKAAGYGDDVINSIDEMAEMAKNTANAAKTTKNIVSNAQPLASNKSMESGSKVVNGTKNVVSKVPGVTKLMDSSKNIVSSVVNSVPGKVVSDAFVKAVSTSPSIVNAAAAATGTIASGNLVSSPTKPYIINSPDYSTVLGGKSDMGTVNYNTSNKPEITPEVNGYNQEQNYSYYQNDNDINVTVKPSTVIEDIYNKKTEVVSPENIELPEYPTSNRNDYTPSTKPDLNPNYPGNYEGENIQDFDDIVGNIVENIDGKIDIESKHIINNNSVNSSKDALIQNTVSSDILKDVSDVSGNFSQIITEKGKSIPTLSTPILSDAGEKVKSIVPVGAGLGAAALNIIGAKSYINKKEEEKENVDLEKKKEETNSKYLNIEEKNKDYLIPTDEQAFQE